MKLVRYEVTSSALTGYERVCVWSAARGRAGDEELVGGPRAWVVGCGRPRRGPRLARRFRPEEFISLGSFSVVGSSLSACLSVSGFCVTVWNGAEFAAPTPSIPTFTDIYTHATTKEQETT